MPKNVSAVLFPNTRVVMDLKYFSRDSRRPSTKEVENLLRVSKGALGKMEFERFASLENLSPIFGSKPHFRQDHGQPKS